MGGGVVDALGDIGTLGTGGIVDFNNGFRFNVPFSGGQIGSWLKSTSNLYTAEQLRHEVNDTFSTGLAKQLEGYAGMVEAAVVTAGVGTALAAPAEAGAAALEGGAATATEASVAGTEAGIGGAAEGAGTGAASTAGEGALDAGTNASLLSSSEAPTVASETAAPASEFFDQAPGAAKGVGNFPSTSMDAAASPASGDAASAYVPGQGPPLANPVSVADATGIPQAISGEIANAGKSFSMVNPGEEASWWAAQSPSVKAALVGGGVLAGGQMITGAMGGAFTGMSAQKRLALETLINQQNQNQRQYLNANNRYAPLLQFKPTATPEPAPQGLIDTAQKKTA